MDYENTQIKLDALIGYFKEGKLNLAPVFQRGRAWGVNMRQELIKNIVRKRPIPAIFLYKSVEDGGSQYTYNILDGKQRLESILLFIGDRNPKLKIDNWKEYIFDRQYRAHEGFKVKYGEDLKKIPFSKFPDEAIRDLREYQLPVIEIKWGEESNLDELVNLFVDINQRGAKVTRLQIVRGVKHSDPFLKSVYELVAEKQRRYHDTHVIVKKGMMVGVLSKLSVVAGAPDKAAKADRMWGKLMELAFFVRNGNVHGKGSDVFKKFVEKVSEEPLTIEERKKLRRTFTFLDDAYRETKLGVTRLANDYSYFYIMATSLLPGELPMGSDPSERKQLAGRLAVVGELLRPTNVGYPPGSPIERYVSLSSRQTTDAKKRQDRQKMFIELVRTP